MQKKILYIVAIIGVVADIVLLLIYSQLRPYESTTKEYWVFTLGALFIFYSPFALIKLAYSNDVTEMSSQNEFGAIRGIINAPVFIKWFLIIVAISGVYSLAIVSISDIMGFL